MAEAKNKKKYYLGTGRRKTSVARVRLIEGTGKIQINGRELEQFFTESKDRNAVIGPLDLVEMRNRLDLFARVDGGGITGQSGALCQGIARALMSMFGLTAPAQPAAPATTLDGQPEEKAAAEPPSMGKKLRDSGYLTRDSRMKERKKYGRKGARKSFQFSKR